ALTVVCVATIDSHAALISLDDTHFGPASVTRDTQTGLDWLDMTATTGRSFEEVQTALATDYIGFRFATRPEIRSLFDSAGLADDGTYFEQPFSDLGPLLNFIGTTYQIGDQARGVFGWTSEMSEPGRVFYACAFERFDQGTPQPFQQIISWPGRA